jgi:hypothetical protein
VLHAVRAYSRRQSRKTFGVYLTETHLPQQLAQSNFVAVLLAVLILVTYVPVTGMGLVDLFYH